MESGLKHLKFLHHHHILKFKLKKDLKLKKSIKNNKNNTPTPTHF